MEFSEMPGAKKVNPVQANVPLFYTPENNRKYMVFWRFQGYIKETLTWIEGATRCVL